MSRKSPTSPTGKLFDKSAAMGVSIGVSISDTFSKVLPKSPSKKLAQSARTSPEIDRISGHSKTEKFTMLDDIYEFFVPVMEREAMAERYGWRKFSPEWLQWARSRPFLLFALCLIAFVQGFFPHGILASNVQPLHKRFHLKTVEIGLIRMTYDLGMIIAFLPVMYFNARSGRYRPQVLALGCVVMAIGAGIYASPQMFVGWNRPPLLANGSCQLNSTTPTQLNSTFTASTVWTKRSTVTPPFLRENVPKAKHPLGDPEACKTWKSLNWTKYIFMIGVFINGLGAAPLFAVGIAFLDENVSHRDSVRYMGILNCVLLFGVACGYWFNGLATMLYVDMNAKHLTGITWESEGWIWPWWLGAVVAMFLTFLVAIPISGFPNRLPDAAAARAKDLADKQPDEMEEKPEVYTKPPPIIKSIMNCLRNPTFVGLTVEQCSYLMLMTGFASFIPLYLRAVYGNEFRNARLLSGGVAAWAMVGSGVGAFFQHHFRLSTKRNLRFSLITSAITLIVLFVVYIPCNDMSFAGETARYPVAGETNVTLYSSCNQHCDCSKDDFNPVCAVLTEKGKKTKKYITYFSACFAGCSGLDGRTDCMCVPQNRTMNGIGGGNLTYSTRCLSKVCIFRGYAFTIGIAWAVFLIFMRINPTQQCLLRCIPSKDRVVGLCLSAIVARVFGAMPGPPIMGYLADYVCNHWGKVCGVDESFCAWRDETVLTPLATGICALVSLIGIAGMALAFFTYKERQESYSKQPSYAKKGKLVVMTASGLKAEEQNSGMGSDGTQSSAKRSIKSMSFSSSSIKSKPTSGKKPKQHLKSLL